MRAVLRARFWRMLTRVGLWSLHKQIRAIGGVVRFDPVRGVSIECSSVHFLEGRRLHGQLVELLTAHADHCERLQHLRAGR